jgi:ATP-binding protein involved in chromosome partitioning
MSYFCCPNCGHRTDGFSHGGARREAEALNAEFLGEIPLDIRIRETSDAGTPIVTAEPQSAHAESYRTIARRLQEKLADRLGSAGRAAPRIVIE